MTRSKIITSHIFPPIPDRQFDWCAYHENDVEVPWLYGWGATKQEALRDLVRVKDEQIEAMLDEHEKKFGPITYYYTEDEIARSQARIAAVLGPEEIAKLDEEAA